MAWAQRWWMLGGASLLHQVHPSPAPLPGAPASAARGTGAPNPEQKALGLARCWGPTPGGRAAPPAGPCGGAWWCKTAMHVNWKPGGAPGRLARAVRPPRRRDPPSPRELPRRGWPPPGPWSRPHGSAIALTALQSAWWPAHRGRAGPGAALEARHRARGGGGRRAAGGGRRAAGGGRRAAGGGRRAAGGGRRVAGPAPQGRHAARVGRWPGTVGPRQGSHGPPCPVAPRVTAARSRPRAPAAPRGTRPAPAARQGARAPAAPR
jgi:hypothetical protein